MSILIKGMAMPKNCWSCPFRRFLDDEDECLAKRMWIKREKGEKIPPVCPLIELPPHGLIDKQMLLRNIADNQFAHPSVGHEEDYAFWGKVWDYIVDAPTIIEAEEKK